MTTTVSYGDLYYIVVVVFVKCIYVLCVIHVAGGAARGQLYRPNLRGTSYCYMALFGAGWPKHDISCVTWTAHKRRDSYGDDINNSFPISHLFYSNISLFITIV